MMKSSRFNLHGKEQNFAGFWLEGVKEIFKMMCQVHGIPKCMSGIASMFHVSRSFILLEPLVYKRIIK